MSMNWFEGGRRVTKFVIGATALIGAYNAYDYSYNYLEFTTATPRDKWHPRFDRANGPEWTRSASNCAETKFLYDFEVKPGLSRDISLCFLPDRNNEIIYYSGQEEKKYLERIEAAISQAKSLNRTKDVQLLNEAANDVRAEINSNGLGQKSGDPFSQEVASYIETRAADFAITPEMLRLIERDGTRAERAAWLKQAKEYLSITAYFILGIWLFSIVVGWIIRGFAGIPRGQDFRPNKIAGGDA